MCQHPHCGPTRRFCEAPSQQQPHRGDVCTIELDLQANHGFVPEPLFDSSDRISFVLDHGNYLPAIHELVRTLDKKIHSVDIDAGYGAYRKDLVLTVPIKKMERFLMQGQELSVGTTLLLPVPVIVSAVHHDKGTVTVDANAPLAGSSYKCTMRLVSIESSPWSSRCPSSSHFSVATLGLGCFWGAELFCMRIPGVVGTRVGYQSRNEVVQVMWDTTALSYRDLLLHALARAKQVNESVMVGGGWLYETNDESDEEEERYRHGIYYHNEEQRLIAEQVVQQHHGGRMMLNPLASFRLAEEDQQQYLYKRGQSARKGAKDAIRCFG